MSASGVSLLQMPEIPMKHILEYLDFSSILILRKVCHDLRNFIDDTKPASRLTEINVDVNSEFIIFCLHFHRPRWPIRIDYLKHGERCLVKTYRAAEDVIKTIDEDFRTVFSRDFNIILTLQKTVLEVFSILNQLESTTHEIVLESANKFLKSMNHLLQVKLLSMEVSNHNEILSILPYIDPKSLKHIKINGHSRSQNMLNLDEIGQLEQWKQADELSLFGFQFPYLDQNLTHFSTINLDIVSNEDLISLKEIFRWSSTLTTIKVYYYESVSSQRLIELFGHPFFDNNQDVHWFFRTSDTNRLLRITISDRCIINFNRIEQSDVPQNAIILN